MSRGGLENTLPRLFHAIMKLLSKDVCALLDCEAVLLPIKKGGKATGLRNWSKLTYPDTQTEAYQKKLENAPALGVVLHTKRTSLCSIDIDDDDLLEIFLKQNPKLKNTLQTKGEKGGNIWLKMKGTYPGFKKLKHDDKPAGEWRVENNYTIITGKHPEGMSYRVVKDMPVLEIEFSEINWQGFHPFSDTCPIDTIDIIDAIDYTDATDYTEEIREGEEKTTFSQKVIKATKAREQLKSNLILDRYYKLYIETTFTARQGERNSQLVAMVTFLFRAVSEPITISLVNYFYDINQDIFIDTRSQHEKEALSHLRATKETWLDSLSRKERELYDEVSQASKHHETAFRVCRELADEDSNLFLSHKQLGDRIGIDQTQAGRILKQFIPLGILAMITKGTQHSKKGAGKATSYRWLL